MDSDKETRDWLPGPGVAFATALALLFAASYTLTTKAKNVDFIRCLLAGHAVFGFWYSGFGPSNTLKGPEAIFAIEFAVFFMFRAVECVACGWGIVKTPAWVTTDGKILPFPTTVRGRLAYSLDYTTSICGPSWFAGVHLGYTPRRLISEHPQSRRTFIINALKRIAFNALLVDIFVNVQTSAPWDLSLDFPLLDGFRIPAQLYYTFWSGVCVITSMTMEHTIIALIAVCLGSHPSSWPPLYGSPLSSTSLADFWSRQWHFIFRRNFSSVYAILRSPFPSTNSLLVERVLRITTIFGLSSILHLAVMWLPPTDGGPRPTFYSSMIIANFLIQPLGLFFESLVVVPLAQHLPLRFRGPAVKIWAWTFTLWTGRWYADVQVKRGVFSGTYDAMKYSVVRKCLVALGFV
jgi:hypothetical protein